MKMFGWKPALLSLSAALLLAPCAWSQPAIFSKLPYDQAKSIAKAENKLLIIDFTASWCPPCKMMDANTWVDPKVEEWFKKNAVALQVDVDEDKDFAADLNVSAMPTIAVFKQGDPTKEVDRYVGFRKPDQLLDWLNGVLAGKTFKDSSKATFESVVGKGGEAEVSGRYEFAKQLQDSGDVKGAAEQYIWLWKNIMKEYPPMVGVRGSYMAANMGRLAEKDESVKASIAKLRDEAETKDRGDWITLNETLMQPELTLAWFDRVKKDKSENSAKELKTSGFLLSRILIVNNRWPDVAYLHKDPIAELKDKFRFAEDIISYTKGRDVPQINPFPKDAAVIYAALLAAGRTDEAIAVKKEAIKLQDSPKLRQALSAMAQKAGQKEPEEK
jgi:thiol-disulfide isomerase/thioredoxin